MKCNKFKIVVFCMYAIAIVQYSGVIFHNATPDYTKTKKGIVLLSRRCNYAWGVINEGYYVDSEGYKVDFDLAEQGIKYMDGVDLVDPLSRFSTS